MSEKSEEPKRQIEPRTGGLQREAQGPETAGSEKGHTTQASQASQAQGSREERRVSEDVLQRPGTHSSGIPGLPREPESLPKKTTGTSAEKRDAQLVVIKAELRSRIHSIRAGHMTGGYCDTERLVIEERKLHALLAPELEQLKLKHGYSPDPKFKHGAIRAVELELNGLAYKPKLVEMEEDV
jgi:hypothetical protein